MNAQLQTWIALLAVAVAASWLVWRSFLRPKTPGCGGDCGCPSSELKEKLKR